MEYLTEKTLEELQQLEIHYSALAACAKSQRQKLEEKYVNRFGQDQDYSPGVIVGFEYQFSPYGQWYEYAAIKCSGNGLWYTTGPKSPKGYTWEQFTCWLSQGAVRNARSMGVRGSVSILRWNSQ